jgi:hypothetical protein
MNVRFNKNIHFLLVVQEGGNLHIGQESQLELLHMNKMISVVLRSHNHKSYENIF